MRKRLDERAIKYLIRQLQKGARASHVALQLGVTSRHVRRLWEHFLEEGSIDCIMPRPAGRPASQPAQDMIDAVVKLHEHEIMGVQRTVLRLHELGINISYYDAYRIMTMEGMIETSEARSGRRKWIRYERRYSNAMWHVDWHLIRDPRLKGANLIVYLDDASRCVTGFGVFEDATSANAVLVLRKAITRFGAPASILSDNGKCFTVARNPSHRWHPTLFEEELLENDIFLINSRPYHPQTNGKLERFFRTFETEVVHHDRIGGYIDYYNEDRLHFSLDIANYEKPLEAFHARRASEAIRESNPKWMEEDINDRRT